MTALSDAAVTRLRAVAAWPEFDSPRYTVSEEIGRGGMGTVYLATDNELGREVALKIPNGVASAAFEQRLRVEARVLARLEHPGIVPIHDVGRLADGRLFYVMKRVRGHTLREQLRQMHELSERLRIFERVCEPVAFAHAHGFIHRDLKPENVMVGAFGEVMVMDWGVAKIAGEGSGEPEPGPSGHVATPGATSPGTIIGTRGFMPPEQASGDVHAIDQRSDVYALGAILYLLLTGHDPDPDGNPASAIAHAAAVPRPLAAICARALADRPAARYPSVGALAGEVARFRAGQRVLAYRETVLERVGRFARTYRTAILLVLAYIVMRAIVAWTTGS